ncbi:hypothetical protein ACROYT_G002887 [Oculina patagonica]
MNAVKCSRISGNILKVSAVLILTMFFMSPFVDSSILRGRRSTAGQALVGPAQIGISSPPQVLNDWCANLTRHLNTTLDKFGSIAFNRSMASSNISSSGVTVLQRLEFDLEHLKIYALLFGQIPSFIAGQQFDLCLYDGTQLFGGLMFGMQLAESFLNGTSPLLPQFLHGGKLGSQTRYQDLSREIAELKGQMRELVIILGSNIFGSAHVSSK